MFDGIRDFIQRGRKGYASRDLWSFDNWLSKTIARGLRELKSTTSTYPNDIMEWDEWMKILDEMIECFDEQTRGMDNLLEGKSLDDYHKMMKRKKQKLHRGLQLLERYYYDLWD